MLLYHFNNMHPTKICMYQPAVGAVAARDERQCICCYWHLFIVWHRHVACLLNTFCALFTFVIIDVLTTYMLRLVRHCCCAPFMLFITLMQYIECGEWRQKPVEFRCLWWWWVVRRYEWWCGCFWSGVVVEWVGGEYMWKRSCYVQMRKHAHAQWCWIVVFVSMYTQP